MEPPELKINSETKDLDVACNQFKKTGRFQWNKFIIKTLQVAGRNPLTLLLMILVLSSTLLNCAFFCILHIILNGIVHLFVPKGLMPILNDAAGKAFITSNSIVLIILTSTLAYWYIGQKIMTQNYLKNMFIKYSF